MAGRSWISMHTSAKSGSSAACRAERTAWAASGTRLRAGRLLASSAVPGGIHHSVVVVGDLEASLRFYRDGLGLDLLADRQVDGDWPDLFDAPGRRVRAVFLGDAAVP